MKVEFHVDGCCLNNGQPGAKMGIGIVGVCQGKYKEWSIPVDSNFGKQSSPRAEVIAIKLALLQLPWLREYDVIVYTDSQYAIETISGNWSPAKNLDVIQETQVLASRCKSFRMIKVKGHSGDENNTRADALANEGARGFANVYTRQKL